MEKEKIDNLNVMIDDYVAHKTDLEKASTMLDCKRKELDYVRKLYSMYEDIAIYRGVVEDLSNRLQTLLSEVKALEKIENELKARDKGFEGTRRDVIAELTEETFENQKQ